MNNNNQNNNNTYKATTNLNTVIDNPQINVNSATDVNVQDLNSNNYVESNIVPNQTESNSFMNNQYSTMENTNNNNNQDIITDNFSNNQVNNNDTSIIDTIRSNTEEITTTTTSINNNEQVKYAPTLEEKKVVKESILSPLIHSKEFKMLIFLMLILCMFLLLMPYLYDFIRSIASFR